MEKYRELERDLARIKKAAAEEADRVRGNRMNEKLMKLPLERFLLQYKIVLKRELCINRYCHTTAREECDKAHSLRELFTQFDQSHLKEFYSYHFSQVRPFLPKTSKYTTKIEFSCHRCKSTHFKDPALLLLKSIQGDLIEPRVARTCLYCDVETHFLVYFRD